MLNIALSETLAKLPFEELRTSIRDYMEPMTAILPEKRLREVVNLCVQNILATETPVIAAMSRGVSKVEVYWLRRLGGKLGLKSDRDGPYCLFH